VARGRRLVLLSVLVVLCGACRVDVNVGIDAAANGSGRVRVEVVADREAAEAVDLSAGVRVDDLKQAGWTVEGPSGRPDGSVSVVATKPFVDAEGARLAIEELTGPTGPFRGFRLQRHRSFARTTTRFSGTVDFTQGIEAFGDPGVKGALGGSAIGVDLTRLEQELKGPVDKAVGVQVALQLPGDVKSNAARQAGRGARWQLSLHDRVDLTAESTAWNVANLAAAAVLILAAVGLLSFLAVRRRRPARARLWRT